MQALESVVVNQSGEGRSGFQITFRAERGASVTDDFALLKSEALSPGRRAILIVTISGTPTVLMDGIITQHELTPSSGSTPASLTVTGEDLSVMMDLYDVLMEYPSLPHVAIAGIVIAKYAALGIVPLIIPAPAVWGLPLQDVFPQRGTDLHYLKELAETFGYVFYVRPGPVAGMNIAFWGPSLTGAARWLPTQRGINVDMGPATNVNSIQFHYDALAAAMTIGVASDFTLGLPVPFAALTSTRLPPLASQPALPTNAPFLRERVLDYRGSNAIEAFSKAQGQTNDSTANVVTASGVLDVFRYGALLIAPGRVGVRGAGYQYDGEYFVQTVSHQITQENYTQSFTLSREGVGSLVTEVRSR